MDPRLSDLTFPDFWRVTGDWCPVGFTAIHSSSISWDVSVCFAIAPCDSGHIMMSQPESAESPNTPYGGNHSSPPLPHPNIQGHA